MSPAVPPTPRSPHRQAAAGPLVADRSVVERARANRPPASPAWAPLTRPSPLPPTVPTTARHHPNGRRAQPARPTVPRPGGAGADPGRRGLRPRLVLVVLAVVVLPSLVVGARLRAQPAEPSVTPAAVLDPPMVPSDADELVATLATQADVQVPRGTVSIAAMPVAGDGLAASRGDRLVKSASTAKAWFAAAALAANPIEAVEPYAAETFGQSSDFAAGHLIELAGGPDAVNDFTRDRVGMADTGLVRWVGETTVRSTNVADRLASSNYTTAPDMALFLQRLARGELLDGPRTEALLRWMRLSPRDRVQDEFGGWLPDQLPPAVRADVSHKAGWLFPDGDGEFWLLDYGVVRPPAGEPYVFVVAGSTTADYAPLKSFVGRASCLAYRTFSTDHAWSCTPA